MDEEGEKRQLSRINQVKQERNNAEVQRTLSDLQKAASGTDNVMPFLLDAVREYATLGEICGVLRNVFGSHQQPSVY